MNYLRIAVTDRCNLRCVYCMPEEGIELKRHKDMLSYEEIIKICETAITLGIEKIRLTGGEPLVRKDICLLVNGISSIPGIKDLAMTTNGIYLEDFAADLKISGLRRVNVSLDSLNPDRYAKITRGGDLSKVLAGIDRAIKVGLTPVKINIVLSRSDREEFNEDEIEDFKRFSNKSGVKLQFIRQMSLRSCKTAFDEGSSNICSRPPDCGSCNRIRLTADGKFKPCLFSDTEIDVREFGAARAMLMAVESKPEAGQTCYKREMVQIGG
ncbi:MAG: radical SAM protein [Candidatus Margulisiibacteriota bacterium]